MTYTRQETDSIIEVIAEEMSVNRIDPGRITTLPGEDNRAVHGSQEILPARNDENIRLACGSQENISAHDGENNRLASACGGQDILPACSGENARLAHGSQNTCLVFPYNPASISRLAVRALLYEVCATPKPGLVDRANSGSHTDMDICTFVNSAFALQPYFETCARIGQETAQLRLPARETFLRLRPAGVLAEKEMFAATGGVNTHKGAIFSMGILCAAAGRLTIFYTNTDIPEVEYTGEGPHSGSLSVGCTDTTPYTDNRPHGFPPADAILSECAAMTRGLVASDFAGLTEANAVTAGQRLYLHYGITGIRGQAEAGFPAVRETGLPVLTEGLARGLSLNDAGCAALLALMCAAADTNLIARSDIATWRNVTEKIRELLLVAPYPDEQTLTGLDRQFIARNLSPGGSADLLALSYLLYFMQNI